ncbi:MAG: GTPase ObgE [Oscillospiraceae bacterium]|jgi:GTP-binding protein|nr:GTPase ObgE [Oscillospiraceae bacterium]
MTTFTDKAKIFIKAGDGGDGAVSFHREKYVANGGPDGGDGGKGGDVVFVIDDNFSSLIDFRYKRKYVANKGENGKAKRQSGRKAEDLIVKIPRGTVVKDFETGRIIADMSVESPQIIAKGGDGGRGNQHFATSTRQAPRFSKPGYPGEEYTVQLELKLIADVGLVGFPNVGKSSLISAVSAAKPVIANYHFTTLTPVLGVVRIDEEQSFVMADIPGLIEGASEGVGLGHEFLRHVERCRLIVHVVDISEIEGRNAIEDYEKINKELETFSEDLAKLPQIIVANKSDIATEEQIEKFREYVGEKPFFAISAVTHAGTKELIEKIAEELQKLPPVTIYKPEPKPVQEKKQEFTVTKEDGVFCVNAKWLEPIIRTVNMDDYSSLQYFQRVIIMSGIEASLQELGIQDGDIVNVEGFEFEYVR